MLNEIALARAVRTSITHHFSYAVELLVAREDEEALACLSPLFVFFFDLLNELAQEVEHAIARPGLFPQIARGKSLPSRRYRWVAGTAELALIKGEKPRLRPCELR